MSVSNDSHSVAQRLQASAQAAQEISPSVLVRASISAERAQNAAQSASV
jgi:hypothetical protein